MTTTIDTERLQAVRQAEKALLLLKSCIYLGNDYPTQRIYLERARAELKKLDLEVRHNGS